MIDGRAACFIMKQADRVRCGLGPIHSATRTHKDHNQSVKASIDAFEPSGAPRNKLKQDVAFFGCPDVPSVGHGCYRLAKRGRV